MATHNDLGQWGEQKAVELLEAKGYRIMERDWHCGHRDIDIVAMDCDELVFVEVKTRSGNLLVAPELAVNREKMQSLSKAANAFVKTKRIGLPMRFDIISIIKTDNGEYEIKHIENAFLPIPYYTHGR